MIPLLLSALLACTTETPAPAVPAPPTAPPPAAPAPAAEPAADAVHVADAWVRAMPPGSPNTGAFMSLHNAGSAPTAIVGASSDVAEKVELHTHVMEGGVAQMRPVERFELGADAMHELKPGGDHIMFIGLKGDLALGHDVAVTLRFADGSEQVVTAPVQDMPAAGGAGDAMGGHAH
ncbi:copper chaperone PCu(A)C [Myxococcota bacterium]|nr:copper chaperone PCu(A)C [Myxococcota bacterium]